MSVTSTIQDLYEDIADIKEYICNPPPPPSYRYIYLRSSNVASASTISKPANSISKPANSYLFVITCEGGERLSRILDRNDERYDFYISDGFGYVSQGRQSENGFPSLFGFSSISSISSSYILLEEASFIRVSLQPDISCVIDWYEREVIS